MDIVARFIIRHRKPILAIFILAAFFSTALVPLVGVNYNMADYLPPDAQSTKAPAIMTTEFSGSLPNTSVMVRQLSVQEALWYKRALADIDGVESVMWLDDVTDITQPLEMADAATVEAYYKNENALFSVTVADGREVEVVDAIWELVGEENAVTGEAADLAAMQRATGSEVAGAMMILLPIILLILVISTSSWYEPVLFLATIGVSILINMGTNLIFGQISFMTNSVSPILQLAVSLDYAIFLLHSFSDYREKYGDPERAMKHAIRASMSTVAASAATTLFGFLALTFMNFQIGADLGLTLAKGIVLSFIGSMVFLPALLLCTYKLLDKTRHRPFMPGFRKVGRVFSKLMVPAVILVALLIVPSFLGQGRTEFVYGNANVDSSGDSSRSRAMIREEFGQSTALVLLVPRGDVAREYALGQELLKTPHVTGVTSYAQTVGTAFPGDYLGEGIVSQFYSENWARLILYTDTPEEGDAAFATVERVMAKAGEYYDTVYSVGQSANLYDMKTTVATDNTVVTLIAVVAIFGVLLVTFKSATLPLILLLTIETGIWINLAIPYFTGTSINFIGYLVLNTVQLGATVDYAILLTNTYLKHRKKMPQREAMHAAMGSSFPSILVSALTLAMAGFTLYSTSSNAPVADIGLLLFRGTLLSGVMVLCFLPAMLKILDRPIGRTTYQSRFLPRDAKPDADGDAAAPNK